MNMKPLAMLALSGVALSIGYIAPAMADVSANPATISAAPQPIQPSTAIDASSGMQIAANNADGTNLAAGDATANVGSGNDDGTPDTATGDDDY